FAQAVNAKDRGSVELVMDSILYPLTTSIVPPSPKPLPKEIEESFVEKATQRAKYDEDMQMIYLKEIEVKAARITKEDRYVSPFYSSFATAITQEDIDRRHATHVIQLLQGIAGVQINTQDNSIVIRGPGSINSDSAPLLLLDGFPIENDMLDLINVQDIARVEIFKGPEAAIFGVRASGGAIQFISKKGEMEIIEDGVNITRFSILGYQSPVEFYAPIYDTPQKKSAAQPDMRATVYWKPDIVLNEEGKATIEFYTSDIRYTRYSIVLEGLSTQGDIIHRTEEIVIE
ncbi:Plug domain-containing protein, partial [Parabacteroides sp. OttesenSCG-928-K15]|nr:Plug domain-containing protein [Parabacteroides sp. OttesenSCG-928-K15]